MNRDVMEAASNILSARAAQNDELWHYGTPRHSGRYPYGSGKRPHQHDGGSKGPSGEKYGGKHIISPKEKTKIWNTYSKSKYDDDISDDIFGIIKANKTKLKEAKSIINDSVKTRDKIADEFNNIFAPLENNKNTLTYYEAVSEIADSNNRIDDFTLDDMAQATWMGVWEDGQQGYCNAYSLYAYDNGYGGTVDAMRDYANNVEKNAKKSASQIIQQAFDEVGGQKLTVNSNSNYSLSEALANRIDKHMLSENTDMTLYMLDNSVPNFDSNTKKAINSAEKWVSKVNDNSSENTWYLFNTAVQNLGMSNIKCNDMTDSDWKKINDEILRMKRR